MAWARATAQGSSARGPTPERRFGGARRCAGRCAAHPCRLLRRSPHYRVLDRVACRLLPVVWPCVAAAPASWCSPPALWPVAVLCLRVTAAVVVVVVVVAGCRGRGWCLRGRAGAAVEDLVAGVGRAFRRGVTCICWGSCGLLWRFVRWGVVGGARDCRRLHASECLSSCVPASMALRTLPRSSSLARRVSGALLFTDDCLFDEYAEFLGLTWFQDALVGADAVFSHDVFSQAVSHAVFPRGVFFSRSLMFGETFLEYAAFAGMAVCVPVVFGEKARFCEVAFGQDVLFVGAVLHGGRLLSWGGAHRARGGSDLLRRSGGLGPRRVAGPDAASHRRSPLVAVRRAEGRGDRSRCPLRRHPRIRRRPLMRRRALPARRRQLPLSLLTFEGILLSRNYWPATTYVPRSWPWWVWGLCSVRSPGRACACAVSAGLLPRPVPLRG